MTSRSALRTAAGSLVVALTTTLLVAGPVGPAAAATTPSATIDAGGNPILADGSAYSADAAPLVVGDTLYVYAGHDEAAEQQAAFVMNDYQIFATDDVASGLWDHYPENLVPGEVFSWATGRSAFAGQVTTGADGKFYWYVPVEWENTSVPNRMAIGVAVSDGPTGPWTDAVGAPLLTWTDVFGSSTDGQEVIDPHVFTDSDGRVYLYWGSWGVARVVELDASMTARKAGSTITRMSGLTSFFEAPWVFKRNGTYYMTYDWKQGGSACTPSNYQACVAYATATNPLGPWHYQGIILGGTSATTVHPSIIEFDGSWYLTYHTKDAVMGGHFRRSVAIDELNWDGDRILPVTQTWAEDPAYRLSDNLATGAQVSASYTEQPPMRLGALNDGRALTALLPPDQWGNYRGTTSSNASDWVQYEWDAPVRTGSVGIQFHRDGNWIRPPASWVVEYRDTHGDWQEVDNATYPTATGAWHTVTFDPVTTTALRATFQGLPEGPYVHSVSVSEWEVYAVQADSLPGIDLVTPVGVAPELPVAVRIPYGAAGSMWTPVNWFPVDPSEYAEARTFTVEGRVLGQKAGYITATVEVGGTSEPGPDDTQAPTVMASAAGTEGQDGWFRSNVTVRVAADDETDYLTTIRTQVGDAVPTVTEDVRHVDLTVTAEGTTTVRGSATDAAGNTSADVTRIVKIDKAAPQLTAPLDSETRSVTVSATDALSGVAGLEYRFDGAGSWVSVENEATIEPPDALPHDLAVRARDLAGNQALVLVDIPLAEGAVLHGNVAPYATASASYTSPWESVNGTNDGTNGIFENVQSKTGRTWGTWPRVGEQWSRLTWGFDVTVDKIGVWWFQDAADTANAGMIAPRSWVLQYLDADGTTWRDVTLTGESAYARTSTGFIPVSFQPVTTSDMRIVAQAWGAAEGQGSVGIREWQVIAADTSAPTVSGSVAGRVVTVTATDDDSGVDTTEYKLGDSGAWTTYTGPVTVAGTDAVTVFFRATDVAGNVSAVGSVDVAAVGTVAVKVKAGARPPAVAQGESFSLEVSVDRAVKPHAAPAPTGTVTATIGGADHVVQLVDGRAELPLATAGLEPGVYAVEVSYSGDTTYAGGDTSVQVEVRPLPPA
jgi:hypothetical protein